MAVLVVGDVFARPFSGYEDPGLPTGMWLAEQNLTGDATGGDMTLQFDFAKATGLRNSQYYSLEELMIIRVGQVTSNGRISFANLSLGPALTIHGYTFIITSNEGSFTELILTENTRPRLFLGRQTNPNSATSVNVILDNINLIGMRARIGGYVWSARSTAVPGGPRRPPSGLYPN